MNKIVKKEQFSEKVFNLVDSLPGSFVLGILQARILEWVAISSSRASCQPRDQTHISYVSCIGRQVLYHSHHVRIHTQTHT